jgi:hypothetical protein
MYMYINTYCTYFKHSYNFKFLTDFIAIRLYIIFAEIHGKFSIHLGVMSKNVDKE